MPETVGDVTVVGAGPAGSATAIELARAGLDVTLVDKATFPRDKTCGDGLTTPALRLLDRLGLEPKALPSWRFIRDVVVRTPDGCNTLMGLPGGPEGEHVAVVRRLELDAALVDLARRSGVRVLEGVAVAGVCTDADHTVITTQDGEQFSSPYLVAADGVWSSVRKMLSPASPTPYLGTWHAFRQYVAGAAAQELWVLFEADLLPGYAWSFPLGDGSVNIGYGILRRPGLTTGTMRQHWDELWSRPHLAALVEGGHAQEPPRSWPIPGGVDAVELTIGSRVLFVGDAARAADTFTGEGIAQALETGMLAAQAIVAAGPHRPFAAVRHYRRQVARGLAADERFGRALAAILGHERGANKALRLARSTDAGKAIFARWMFDNLPRGIWVTPGRWRSVARRAPAFAGADETYGGSAAAKGGTSVC
jgi:geranylgeranyl reductase family protein